MRSAPARAPWRSRRLRRQPGARANYRRDEGMKSEDRRGRESGQNDQRLVTDDRKAKRLAGFERDAVHQDAGLAELRDNTMRQIAGAFRRAAATARPCRTHRAPNAWQVRARPPHPETRRKAPARRRLRRRPPRGSRHCCRKRRPAAAACPARPVRRRSKARRRAGGAQRRSPTSPHAASMPISREPSRVPWRNNVSPRAISDPA